MSILTKLLIGFLSLLLVAGGFGAYGYYAITNLGGIAIDTYDKPLMAINFARAAATDFARIEHELLVVTGTADALEMSLLEPSAGGAETVEPTDLGALRSGPSERQRLLQQAVRPAWQPAQGNRGSSLSERQRLLEKALQPAWTPAGSAAEMMGQSERQRLLAVATLDTATPLDLGESDSTGSDIVLDEEKIAHLERIGERAEEVYDDLEVASERALTEESRGLAETLMGQIEEWSSLNEEFLAGETTLQPDGTELLSTLHHGIDELVELNAAEGFEFRLNAEQQVERSWQILLGLVAFAAVLAIANISFLIYQIARPLRRVIRALNALTKGDTSVVVEVRSKDEIGDIANAIRVFRQNLDEIRKMEVQQVEIRDEAENRRRQSLEKVANDFEKQVKGVVETVSATAKDIQVSANSMSEQARQTSDQSGSVSKTSEQAASNVNNIAAATEQMSAAVETIGQRVAHSNEITKSAVDQVQVTNETIQGLSNAAQRIGDVVSMISKIAEQTNLLALNATIEAARAGESGKGFSVVASEVKSLANQTAKATEEISQQIGEMQTATNEAVSAIDGIGQTIEEIHQATEAIIESANDQRQATDDITANIGHAADGTRAVSQQIAEVSGVAGETGSAAGQVLDRVNLLSDESETLRSSVDRFLSEVRTLSNANDEKRTGTNG